MQTSPKYPHLFFYGNEKHGKELIDILVSKGGKNPDNQTGTLKTYIYYISPSDGHIRSIPRFSTGAEITTSLFTEILPPDFTKEKGRCSLCGGRLALVYGTFYYEPDDEPFESGVEEDIELDNDSAKVSAMVCVDCGDITNFNYEGRS